MARRSISLTDALYDYILEVSLREPEVLRRLREETARHEKAVCQIAPEQGQFMAFLVKLIHARQCLEIGVFTGYSALWVALALPPEGRLVACDINAEWTAVARRYWKEAGVDSKVDLRLAPAADTLNDLLENGAANRFDFAFIDADRPRYIVYYEQCLRLVRPGGLILIDNVLRDGLVLDRKTKDPDVTTVQDLNVKLRGDDRVDLSLVPVADGLALLRKK